MANTCKMQPETEAAAAALAAELNKRGIAASWTNQDSRDWLAKVRLAGAGNICLYSNAKSEISTRYHEVTNKTLIPMLEAACATITGRNARATTETLPQFTPLDTAQLPLTAHPDGSFAHDRTGFGVIITDSAGRRVHEARGGLPNNTNRQIIGEIEAVRYTLRWAKENGITQITVCPDYKGIIEWAQGTWKANDPAAKAYVSAVRESGVRITFKKAKGHSADPLNERADVLADEGRALAIGEVKTEDVKGVTLHRPTATDLTTSQPNPREKAEAALLQGDDYAPVQFLNQHGTTNEDLSAFLRIAHNQKNRRAVESLTLAAGPQQHGLVLRLAANFGTPDTFRSTVHLLQASSAQADAAIELARINPEPGSRAALEGQSHRTEMKGDIQLYFDALSERPDPLTR